MKVLFRGADHPDQYDFGALLGGGPKFPAPAQPWLLPNGRVPLPFFKRTFIYLVLLRIHGSELRRWM